MSETDPARLSLANVIAFSILAVSLWASIFVYENITFTALLAGAAIVYLLRLSPEVLGTLADIFQRLFGDSDDPTG